jgi:hypothetical protein
MTKLAHSPLPPLELLQELFVISPDSPSGLRWKFPRATNVKVNDIAGTKSLKGYWYVNIKTDKKRSYLAHRIVYFLQTKQDPGLYQVDHINGKSDPLVLRRASHGENQANSKKRQSRNGKKCSSAYKGVTWHENTRKWRAQISFQGKQFNLGCFIDEIDAAKAYNKAASEYFGEYASLNTFGGAA